MQLKFHPIGRVLAGALCLVQAFVVVSFGVGLYPGVTPNSWPSIVIMTCLALASLGFMFVAAGALEIRFDEKGIIQRNLVLQIRRLSWESVKAVRMYEELVKSEEWRIIGKRACLEITGDSTKVTITPDMMGPSGWWEALLVLVQEKAGQAKFSGFCSNAKGRSIQDS